MNQLCRWTAGCLILWWAGISFGGEPPQGPPPGAPPPAGGFGKAENLPPGLFVADHAEAKSPFRTRWVHIPASRTRQVRTMIVEPAGDGPAPVVVLAHYDAGLDALQRGLAHQLAQDGFLVVVPDLLSGRAPGGGNYDAFRFPDEALRAMRALRTSEAIADLRAAHDYALKLPRANGKSASLGCGLGGQLSFQMAADIEGLDASVVFYGMPPNAATLAKVRAPVLGLYAGDDEAVDRTIEPTAQTLSKLGQVYEHRLYPGATRFFLSYVVEGGNGQAMAQAWPEAISFLKSRLQ